MYLELCVSAATTVEGPDSNACVQRQISKSLECHQGYKKELSLAALRDNCRDGGVCCCLRVPSCAGRASSGRVHLGSFHGAVGAVRASVLDALLNSLYTNF